MRNCCAEVRHCRLLLLDRLELVIGSRRLDVPVHADRLLALLAISGRPVSRDVAARTLWPEMPESRASAKLRSVLWRTADCRDHVIELAKGMLTLAKGVWVDFYESTYAAERLVDPSTVMERTELTAAMHVNLSSDLLPQLTEEDWLTPDQERFRQLRLHALEALCERLTAVGWHGAAVDAGLRAVCADPLRESAHYSLIRAYLAEGNRSSALQQFASCRKTLAAELRLEPSPELRRLVMAGVSAPASVRATGSDPCLPGVASLSGYASGNGLAGPAAAMARNRSPAAPSA
jgi:DNA-binding SARP family transcriptional activator